MANTRTANCGTVWPSRYLRCGEPLIQTYRTNQWSNKVCATPVSTVLFCYSWVRRWWPTSLCFYSWSLQWLAPPSAPPDRVLPVCLNALQSPLKALQMIWDACGGKCEHYPLLGREASMFSCRNTTLLSLRDVGIRFCRNMCRLRPDYKTSRRKRVNVQIIITLHFITLELIICLLLLGRYIMWRLMWNARSDGEGWIIR